jgi:anti-anti-sigma factor
LLRDEAYPLPDALNGGGASILAAVHPGSIAVERRDAGVVIVSLAGEHDLSTAPEVRERVAEALSAGGGVVLSLTAAEFIDSAIIGVVLDARRRAGEAGIGFATALEGGQSSVRRVLEVTGLDINLPVRGSEREAIELAAAGPGEPVL